MEVAQHNYYCKTEIELKLTMLFAFGTRAILNDRAIKLPDILISNYSLVEGLPWHPTIEGRLPPVREEKRRAAHEQQSVFPKIVIIPPLAFRL